MSTNYERAFAERPDVYAAWAQLNGAIKAGMDLRRYELATLAAARRLRSSYCCLAHGVVLQERFEAPVVEIARDHRAAGLDEVDVAVMDLSERVVDDATSVSDTDLQSLRELGLSESEIMDVVLAAAARCFFSKRSTPSASYPTRATATSMPISAKRSSSAARSPTPEATLTPATDRLLGKRDRVKQRQPPLTTFAVEDDCRRGRNVLCSAVHRVVLVEPAGQDAGIAPDLLVYIPELRPDVGDGTGQLAKVRVDLISAA